MFTLIQLFPLLILIIVKMTIVAALFPLLVICLVPVRKQLYRLFTEKELEEVSVIEFHSTDLSVFKLDRGYN